MRSRLSRFRLSPAFPISLLALFVALGGVAGAVATVGTGDIKNGAVTSKKIKDGTIKKKDLKFTIPTGGGAQGPAGPQGIQGPQGPSGQANVQADLLGSVAVRNGTLGDPNDPPASTVLASSDGFAWVLACPESPAISALLVVNVSGGNNSHIQIGAASTPNDDFDEGTVNAEEVTSTGADNTMQLGQLVLIYGTAGNGTTSQGLGGVLNNPNDGQFAGDPDCVGSVNYLAG
jgi:hypothetical protein